MPTVPAYLRIVAPWDLAPGPDPFVPQWDTSGGVAPGMFDEAAFLDDMNAQRQRAEFGTPFLPAPEESPVPDVAFAPPVSPVPNVAWSLPPVQARGAVAPWDADQIEIEPTGRD